MKSKTEEQIERDEGNASGATSHDVARYAGVSQTTVSRTFRASGLVSPKTRARVMEAAEALAYHPHAHARSLTTGRSWIIGIVVAQEYQDYFGPLITTLGGLLAEQGFHLMIFLAPEKIAEPKSLIRKILEYRVDGLVLASINISSHFAEECQKAKIPVILFNRHQQDKPVSSVTTDDFGGGRAAADLFARTGHRRVSVIVGREDTSTSRDREAGFRDGLRSAGLPLFSRGVGRYNPEIAAQAALEMLDHPAEARPDGVFVTGDRMAVAVMDTARHRLGLRIPEDVSVIGFDDSAFAEMPSYNLTTYRLPLQRMALETVGHLTRQIETGGNASSRVSVAGTLVERGTVADRRRVS